MKKILPFLFLFFGLQMSANAVVVEPYIAPIPNYFAESVVDFSINTSPYYQYYCDPYYPYYCRKVYYTSGVYVSPYWNIGIGFNWRGPHYHSHIYRPSHHHLTPARPHSQVKYHSVSHPHHSPSPRITTRSSHKAHSSSPARTHSTPKSHGGSHSGHGSKK